MWYTISHLFDYVYNAWIIQGMGLANERRCYILTPPLIGRVHTQNDPCNGCTGSDLTIPVLLKIFQSYFKFYENYAKCSDTNFNYLITTNFASAKTADKLGYFIILILSLKVPYPIEAPS